MDIDDIISFQPSYTPKPLEQGGATNEENNHRLKQKKKKQVVAQKKSQNLSIGKKETSKKDTLKNTNLSLPHIDCDSHNQNILKKLLLIFDKHCLKNQELRIKFQDNPEKFMESELELHNTIQELSFITTVPELYPLLEQNNFIPRLLSLLLHENGDMVMAVINLLQEIIEIDESIINNQEVLVDHFIHNKICALLVQSLDKFNRNTEDEEECVYNILSIFENLIEYDPEICTELGKLGLLQWILKKLRCSFDYNKLYASELLSILLQDGSENREHLGYLDAIDIILQQLSSFKRHDPKSQEEFEMMENLFDCVCSFLLYPPNKEKFLLAEGLQLMNLMLKEKKKSRFGALKVLDYALSKPDSKENCDKFIDILGLRTIFALFMKPPRKNHTEVEEHTVSIISNLLRNCHGVRKLRLLNKFIENDFEKVDRLLELHFVYLEKVDEVEIKHQNKMDDEEFYMYKLESGLFTLQLIDYILIDICSKGQHRIKQRVVKILNVRGGSLKTIKHIMREYAGNLGDAYDVAAKVVEEQHILRLIDKF